MAEQAAAQATGGQGANQNTEPSPVITAKRKAMKKRSKVWDHFTKFVNDAGEIRGGRVLDSFRSSLTPKAVQSLICAQDWLRHSLNYVEEVGDDDFQQIELDFQKIALEATVDI